MIFELVEECNEQGTVTVIIDNYTFNQIMKMLVVEAYHKGLNHEEPEDKSE